MNKISWPLAAFALLSPIAFIGCGGGSDGPTPPTPANPTPTAPDGGGVPGAGGGTGNGFDGNIATTNFAGLLDGGSSLVTFRGNALNAAVTRRIVTQSGSSLALRGIDARVAPGNNGRAGSNGVQAVYGFAKDNRLYTLNFRGTGTVMATPVGAAAVFSNNLNDGNFGVDFNPAADRVRLVSGNQNARLDPNTGGAVDGDANATGVQQDGRLAYATTDINASATADVTAAGYTNNIPDTASTINYGLDTSLDILVTQGRPAAGANPAVSPNTGTLFTVGALGADLPKDAGLEVFGTSNTAVVTGGTTLYQANLGTGRLTSLGRINAASNINDITILP